MSSAIDPTTATASELIQIWEDQKKEKAMSGNEAKDSGGVGDESPRPALLSCPFCQDDDFDLIGLKSHLVNGDCDAFNETELPARW